MTVIKCPICGEGVGSIANDEVIRHFACKECKSMFRAMRYDEGIKSILV